MLKLIVAFVTASVVSVSSLAATAVAPQNRINIFIGNSSIPLSKYTSGMTTTMGEVLTLKSDATVVNMLSYWNGTTNTGGLDFARAPGAFLSTNTIVGLGDHQRLSDKFGSLGQCVAFARSMTGTKTTPSWYAGKSVMDFLVWDNSIWGYKPSSSYSQQLLPGTMIAYFINKPSPTNPNIQYPQVNKSSPDSWSAGHVAIFLGWQYSGSKVIGAYVVDENLVDVVSIGGKNVGGFIGLIQKHAMPISCPTGATCTNTDARYNLRYLASSYYVVDVR